MMHLIGKVFYRYRIQSHYYLWPKRMCQWWLSLQRLSHIDKYHHKWTNYMLHMICYDVICNWACEKHSYSHNYTCLESILSCNWKTICNTHLLFYCRKNFDLCMYVHRTQCKTRLNLSALKFCELSHIWLKFATFCLFIRIYITYTLQGKIVL